MIIHSDTEPKTIDLDRINPGTGRLRICTGITQVTMTDPDGTTRQEWQYEEECIEIPAAGIPDIDLLQAARNILIARVDGLCLRYNEQLSLVASGQLAATAQTAANYAALLTYKQALRDITKNFSALATVSWPEIPE